jgi:glycosidase
MQGFDWNSSKMFDEYNNYVATTEETTEKDTSSGTETGKHMSYWRWLTSRVASIAKLGVTHVWLPPPSQSVSPEGYLPGRLFNLDLSSYGTKADLVTLTSELKKHGITSVCDIVINHRTAEEKGRDGVYNVFPDLDPTSNAPVHWDTWAITVRSSQLQIPPPCGGPITGDCLLIHAALQD